VLEGTLADVQEKDAQLTERVSKEEAELRELRLSLQRQESEKAAREQAHQEVRAAWTGWMVRWFTSCACPVCATLQEVACLREELRVLEKSLKSCDPVKQKGMSVEDEERYRMHAVLLLVGAVLCVRVALTVSTHWLP